MLWWIDIYKPTLNRFDPRSERNHEIALDQNIHAIAMRRSGGIVGSFQHGIGFVDPASGAVTTLAEKNPRSRRSGASQSRGCSGVKRNFVVPVAPRDRSGSALACRCRSTRAPSFRPHGCSLRGGFCSSDSWLQHDALPFMVTLPHLRPESNQAQPSELLKAFCWRPSFVGNSGEEALRTPSDLGP